MRSSRSHSRPDRARALQMMKRLEEGSVISFLRSFSVPDKWRFRRWQTFSLRRSCHCFSFEGNVRYWKSCCVKTYISFRQNKGHHKAPGEYLPYIFFADNTRLTLPKASREVRWSRLLPTNPNANSCLQTSPCAKGRTRASPILRTMRLQFEKEVSITVIFISKPILERNYVFKAFKMLSPNGVIPLLHVSCGTPQSVKSSSAYSARSVSPRLRIKINLTYTMF